MVDEDLVNRRFTAQGPPACGPPTSPKTPDERKLYGTALSVPDNSSDLWV
jgi:hypothetical protein